MTSDHSMTERPRRLHLTAANRAGAYQQFERHVINRLALAILADARAPLLQIPRLSTDPSRPPASEPRNPVLSNTFIVRVESIRLSIPQAAWKTNPFTLLVDVYPGACRNPAQRLTLAGFQGRGTHAGYTCASTEPIYRYAADRDQLRRRDGLSGDVTSLFEHLLTRHAREIQTAFGTIRLQMR